MNDGVGEEAQDSISKIKETAKRVFLEKGYEGTKIRQIADEAGVNLAMVNYYFRSKDGLFKSIYLETFREFIGRMAILLNEETPLEVKIWKVVDRYTDFILENPLLPTFILTEQRKNGGAFFKEMKVKSLIEGSLFRKQLIEEAEKGNIRRVEPLQLIVTILSSIIFPVMAQPILSYVGTLDEIGFRQFMETRKQFVPDLIMTYLRQV